MTYEIVRSRRRTVALEVTREGRVLVRAPLRMTQGEIDRFVAAHADWLEKAKEVLPGKVTHYAAIMGVVPTSVKITAAKSRFGSCSGKNGICFSLYLMQYPEEAIDYVVVHELAHIRHHDHSSAFYAEVAKVMPDYRARMKLLK